MSWQNAAVTDVVILGPYATRFIIPGDTIYSVAEIGAVFLRCGKQFLDDDDLVMDLAEAGLEIAVRGGGVDFVAEFANGNLGGVQPLGRGKGEQGRFVLGADEIE